MSILDLHIRRVVEWLSGWWQDGSIKSKKDSTLNLEHCSSAAQTVSISTMKYSAVWRPFKSRLSLKQCDFLLSLHRLFQKGVYALDNRR